MKTWILPTKGSGLVLTDRPSRAPGDTEIKIRMRGWSLNYRDGGVAKGPVQRDTIPLSDGAGDVVAVGSRVTRFKVGDRVAGTFFQNWIGGPMRADVPGSDLGGPVDGVLADGVLAEEVILCEQGVVRIPDHLSYAEAACLPCAGVTAWNALFEIGRIGPGKSVLLLGTGGVSVFALQFAKLAGANVTLISSSDEKLARARALGADRTINYRTHPDWEKEVGQPVDLVLEVGGPGTMPKSLASVASGGTIVVIGAVGGREGAGFEPLALIRRSIRVQGIFVGSRLMFEDMNRAIEAHRLTPVIDRVFPFEEAREAYAHQASATHFGKVAIA